MSWKTFWMEPTGKVRYGLRRYTKRFADDDWTCAGGWHTAIVWTDDVVDHVVDKYGFSEQPLETPPPDDPRWPTECGEGCGYRFAEHDRYQLFFEDLYRRTDTGELRVQHPSLNPPDVPSAEPGATWDAWWMRSAGPDGEPGEDGIMLMVRCPRMDGSVGAGNDWCVDAPAGGGGRWTRTGDPREANVTASPSIAIGPPGSPEFYHGFLQDGVLTDHIG